MSDYTQLDMEYKREILTNSQSLMFTFMALEKISGVPEQDWIQKIISDANRVVDEMTDEEVETVILGLQERHNSATDPLEAVVIEIRSEGQSDS